MSKNKEKTMSILTLETKKYSIKIDNFEGPLDLLCYLIDKNKMNIYDVNLTEITNQYRIFKCNGRNEFRNCK